MDPREALDVMIGKELKKELTVWKQAGRAHWR